METTITKLPQWNFEELPGNKRVIILENSNLFAL
jgi:hypothetical protein